MPTPKLPDHGAARQVGQRTGVGQLEPRRQRDRQRGRDGVALRPVTSNTATGSVGTWM